MHRVLDRVSELTKKDIESIKERIGNGEDEADLLAEVRKKGGVLWRFDVLESVEYSRVFWSFWKPLTVHAYWPDDSFLMD